MTPGGAASEWARAHCDAAGFIWVKSLTRQGRIKRTVFYVRSGKAKAARQVWESHWDNRLLASNGLCSVCGRVLLQPVLKTAWADDPCAGEELADRSAEVQFRSGEIARGIKQVRAEKAFTLACPACIAEHGLEVNPLRLTISELRGGVRCHSRRHPDLSRFWEGLEPLAEIDLT